jgi:hypothetical protein
MLRGLDRRNVVLRTPLAGSSPHAHMPQGLSLQTHTVNAAAVHAVAEVQHTTAYKMFMCWLSCFFVAV